MSEKRNDYSPEGLKKIYSEKDIWFTKVLPKEAQIMLWGAANVGDEPGSQERIQSIEHVTKQIRESYRDLFYPPIDKRWGGLS